MPTPHHSLRAVFVTTVALFILACAAGTLQSLRREHRLPGIAQEYGSWVRNLLARGDFAQASREMQIAMRLDGTLRKHEAQLALGQALARSGKYDEAIASYRQVLAAEPRNAAAHSELANALAARGDIELAAGEYQKALAIDSTLAGEVGPKLAWARGGALRSRGRLDEAIASYRAALAARPDLADARFDLGITLAARGALPDAVHEFEELVRQRPGDARFHNALGMALAQTGRIDDAVAAYQRGLQVAPQDAELRHNLALAEAARARSAAK